MRYDRCVGCPTNITPSLRFCTLFTQTTALEYHDRLSDSTELKLLSLLNTHFWQMFAVGGKIRASTVSAIRNSPETPFSPCENGSYAKIAVLYLFVITS